GRDLDLGPPDRAADRPEPPAPRAVDADDRRGLGQAVAFVDLDSRPDEEFGQRPGQRRAAGNREPEIAPQALPDLLEDERIGDLRLAGEARGQRLPALHVRNPLAADLDRPAEELPLPARAALDVRHDPGMDLLVDARHRPEANRLDLEEVRRQLVDRLG